jgi:Domain of unknown function (DUF4440)
MRKRMIQLMFVFATILVSAACTVWGERPARVWKDVTGGESLERVFWSDIKAKNWSDLEPHLAPNFILVTPSGSFDRLAAVEHWKELDLEECSLGDFDIQLNGDTYVVSYIVNLRGKGSKGPIPQGAVRAMTVWQHQGREWLALAHAASPTARP